MSSTAVVEAISEQAKAAAPTRVPAEVPKAGIQPREKHNAFFIVLIAIIIAFTVTIAAIGSILIWLSVRDTGVVAGLLKASIAST